MEAIQSKTFSPKELAQVVGVSESSIKRWVDDGRIQVMRTVGGHRRILLREALQFIRSQGMRVLRPDLLGLPDLAGLTPEVREGEFTGEVLFTLLKRGESAKVRGIITNQYLSGMMPSDLFDGPMAEALERLGTLWKQGEEGIYLEHLATTICIEAINQLRLLIPAAKGDAPVALGGAASGDPFILPSLMVSTVLAEAGYVEVNLGPDTPPVAMRHAIDVHQPDLVWLSLTAPLSDTELHALSEQLLVPLERQGIELIVGGQQVEALRSHLPETVRTMASMKELATYVSR